MTSPAAGVSLRSGANPSPLGFEGVRRRPGDFQAVLAGALPKGPEIPSPQARYGGSRTQQAKDMLDEYAAFFVDQMIQSMRSNIFQSGLAGGGRGEQVWQAQLDQSLSRKLAQSFRFHKRFGGALQRLGSHLEGEL